MTCQAYQQQLVPYLHGRLEADHRGELETHLKGCQTCAKELNEFKQLEAGLRDLASMELPNPEKTLAAVNAKIDAWEARQQRLAAWRPNRLLGRYGLAVAAAAAALVLVVRPIYVRLAARPQPTPAVTDRLTSPAPSREIHEDTLQGQRMSRSTSMQPAIRVDWTIRNPIEATTALRQWLSQIPQATLLSGGHEDTQSWRVSLSRDDTAADTAPPLDTERLVVQLPASSYPALLAELAKHGRVSQPPVSEALSTDQPLTVELSLVKEGGTP
jgi:anti-sigma factor RsiW